LKQTLLLSGMAFGVTLGLVIGLRLDPAALAAVVGVGCGIGASVPGTLFVLWVMRSRQHSEGRRIDQRQRRWEGQRDSRWAQPPPTVVVVPAAYAQGEALGITSGAARQLPAGGDGGGGGERRGIALPVPREFVVIGDEGDGW